MNELNSIQRDIFFTIHTSSKDVKEREIIISTIHSSNNHDFPHCNIKMLSVSPVIFREVNGVT